MASKKLEAKPCHVADDKKNSLLETARKRFRLAEDAFYKTRELAREDLEFKAGIQWDSEMRAAREASKRPCLTINRIPQFTRQIANDQRQNRPAIRVLPVDDGADLETAKIYQGIIRHIEYNSNAESAYDHAFEGAVDGGFGFFRIATDYVSPKSFLQEALIKRIPNHFSVLFDPFSRSPDGSDANWAFVFEDVQKDDFLSTYKDAELSKSGNWELQYKDLNDDDWLKAESCRVAEYFYKDFKEETLIQWEADNGEVDSCTKEEFEEIKEMNPDFTFKILNERKTRTAVVKWLKFAGDEVLEETEFPSQWIPIIPVYGAETEIDGKRVFEGIIRHVKDPQRMYNFWATAETETIALAPKAPFIAAEGQIEGYHDYWENANSSTLSVLPYKPVTVDGIAVPPPQRNVYEPPVQAITNARMQSAEDMKATTGLYDSSMGAISNETSGIAIQRRANQAQTSNYHFVDNLNMSIKHAGRILLEIIPVIYDTARAQQILAEDGTAEIVRINEEFERDGKLVTYDLSKGKYDCTVESGPGYATKRQEAVASMLEFIGVYPAAAQFLGDLLAKNMDWPQAQEISERLKRTIPPNIIGDENQEIPPQAQAQLQQMTAMIEQLNAANGDLSRKLETKILEIQSKEKIEAAKLETDILIEKMKLAQSGAQFQIETQLSELQRMQGLEAQAIQSNPNGVGSFEAAHQFQEQQPTGGMPGPYME